MRLPRSTAVALQKLRPVGDFVLGGVVAGLFAGLRRMDRRPLANILGSLLRRIGPLLPEHRTGRANLIAAFPEKGSAEIEEILRKVWDNLGRVAAEFPQIDRLHVLDPARPGAPDIVYTPETESQFHALRTDGKPALIFAAHLGNWEVPARIAAIYGLDTLVLYRRPNLQAAADAIVAYRSGAMGTLVPTSLDAPVKLARALAENRHVAMLVDQHYAKGVEVSFFGRPCRANPLIAKLAREIDCPVHGTRVVRRVDGTFLAEITSELTLPRDAEGRVDITGAMQAITSVVEGWIREHPEQWLWLHRRWR